MLGGCAIGPHPVKKLISPSQALYDQADAYFRQKDYANAGAIYENFIKLYPTHKFVNGAYLGLGWINYLSGEYTKALEYLTMVRTQDKDLKSWVENLSTECKKKIAGTKEAGTTASLFNIPEFTNDDTIKIEGARGGAAKILVNSEEPQLENGLFIKEVALKEGENIITISITDKEGKTETKESKVILDKTNPAIKVTSAELDDFGYVELIGETEIGAAVFAEGEALNVDKEGKFRGQIKMPYNKQIKLSAKDKAGNTTQDSYSDTDYPDRVYGLRVRSVYGLNVDLEWNANREKDLKGYNLYYTFPGHFSDLKKNTEVIRDIKYTVTNLESASTYTFYIRAVDKMGNESQTPSESVNATTP